MTINSALYDAQARRGDIAGPTVAAGISLGIIADALEQIANGGKPTPEQIIELRSQSDRLIKMFDELTGWSDAG